MMRTRGPHHGNGDDRRRGLLDRLGPARLAVAGPVHRASTRSTSSTSWPRRFSHRFAEYHPPASVAEADRRAGRPIAANEGSRRRPALPRSLHEGEPVGRLIVPRLGLKSIVVNGTGHDDLTKGPGRELHTFMPGEGELIYVAGHRTTYLAPFAHIDKLRAGDPITFELPYATFHYEVTEPRDRRGRRPRRAPLAPQGAARAAGLPPALLRHAPLHRLREARPRRAARGQGVRARLAGSPRSRPT